MALRQRLSTVSPSTLGRPRSRTIASNASLSPRYQAFSPSASISATKPAASSAAFSDRARRSSSSATSTRMFYRSVGLNALSGASIEVDVAHVTVGVDHFELVEQETADLDQMGVDDLALNLTAGEGHDLFQRKRPLQSHQLERRVLVEGDDLQRRGAWRSGRSRRAGPERLFDHAVDRVPEAVDGIADRVSEILDRAADSAAHALGHAPEVEVELSVGSLRRQSEHRRQEYGGNEG